MNGLSQSQLLAEMQLMAVRASGMQQIVASQPASDADKFTQLLTNAIDHVNTVQHTAHQLETRYELGEAVDLPEVMMATEKASLEFNALVEARNKVISAYQEIASMPI